MQIVFQDVHINVSTFRLSFKMWVIRSLKFRGNTKKNVSVFFCIIFIIFCLFLLFLGFLWPRVWALIYSMQDSEKSGVIILYVFASSILITCFLMLLALKENSDREILYCLLILILLWHIHLMICFVSLVMHSMNLQEEFRTMLVLYRALPLLCVQGLWFYFISILWYYWRELTLLKDVPAFIHSLRMNDIKQKAMRQDQKERLGELPRSLLSQLTPQARGLSLANAS